MKRDDYLAAQQVTVRKAMIEECVLSMSSTDAIWLLRRLLAPNDSTHADYQECIKIVWSIKHPQKGGTREN